jgi:D-alanyl-D-alanine carboxypeptidase/D-alanyl-D-alanine-endopeptidase (penicillin-binding protein 4)
MVPPRRALALVLGALLLLVAAAPAAAQGSADATLGRSLAKAMRSAGSGSGAFVYNATDRTNVLRLRHRTPRVLASNTKLFTSSAALAQFGSAGTLPTEVRGLGRLEADGSWRGDLYLRGGGDPTFGSSRFVSSAYGSGATVEQLAVQLKAAGIQRVTGRVLGDESRFDARRGTAYSGFRTSLDIGGPLSGLEYNRGLATESGRSFQANPPAFAASKLGSALAARGVKVSGKPAAGLTPGAATTLASTSSPPMGRIIRIMNKPSDNYFAETLMKDVGFLASRSGTTAAGARATAGFARRLGSAVTLSDGSGLSRGDQASPYRVVRLLLSMRARPEFSALFDSLPVAGRDGTLATRMRSGAARGRCRAKTGTLNGVSALSGYCTARSGDVYVMSILMNRVNVFGARRIQDRMANAIAATR